MTILSDTRENPFTEAVSFRPMDIENRNVAEFANFPGKYGFQVQDRIKVGTITVDGTAPVVSFDIVNNDPLPGQVRINHDRGFLFFHVDDNGLNIDVDYEGGGSVSSLENIKSLASGLAWSYGASIDANANSSQDLEREGGVATNLSPFIVPITAQLRCISAASNTLGLDWTADILKNGISIATLTVQDKAFSPVLAISFVAGDTLRLRFTKIINNINRPSINVYLKEVI